MSEEKFDFQVLRGFMKLLYGNWEKEIILIELLNIFEKEFNCPAAGAYSYENGSFLLKAKINGQKSSANYLVICDVLDIEFIKKYKNEYCRPVLIQNNTYLICLGCGEEIYGAIIFKSFSKLADAIDMISLLASQAAIALKKAELDKERKVIEQVAADFSSGLDMKVYYPRFAKHLRQIVEFDKLTITLPDPLCPEKLIVYGGILDDPLRTKTISYEGSAPAWVISTAKHILEEDLSCSKMFSEDTLLLSNGIRCALRVPLLSKGRIIGTLNIGSRMPFSYKKKDINILTEVANRIGPTIENALIYQSVNNNLRQVLFQLEENFSATLNAFTYLLDRRDNGTKGHSLRVVQYSVNIAERLGIKGLEIEELRLGALLHDIGKIGIPDAILFKTQKLTEAEWQIMKTHPRIGAEMLSRIEFLSAAVPIVLHHHERYDGKGYPAGLIGEEIPLAARIFSIADAFDAITSKRPYRDIQSIDKAIDELKRCTGTQFCPTCIDAFLSIPKKELIESHKECNSKIAFKDPYLVGDGFEKALQYAL